MATPLLLQMLRSVLGFAGAAVALVLLNELGGQLAPSVGLPAGGTLRLAWDLGWLAAAGVCAFAIVAFVAPRAPRAHALVLLAMLLAAAVWAVATMGDDFPAWFSAGVLTLLPLQCWLGLRLAQAVRPVP